MGKTEEREGKERAGARQERRARDAGYREGGWPGQKHLDDHSWCLWICSEWPPGDCGRVQNTERANCSVYVFMVKRGCTCFATGASAGRGVLF